MPTYATLTQLRDRLQVDATALPDATATRLLNEAERRIDLALGARPMDPTTGRAVAQVDVAAWQWEALSDATVELAKALYDNPDLFDQPGYKVVQGPDFRTEQDARPARAPEAVLASLAASGLIEVWAR